MKSQNRITKFLLSAMLVLLTIIVLTPPVKAAAPTLLFTATIDPTAAYVGETKTYTITITNVGSGNGNSYYLGSAKVNTPTSYFTVDGSTLSVTRVPAGTAWTATLVGTEIQLYTTGTGTLDNGQYIEVSFDATAIAAGTGEWTTSAYHGTDWSTPAAISGPQPTVTVTSAIITAIVDIDPDTLNLSSEGVPVTAYIQLPQGYDVEDIDVDSILLNDSVPVAVIPNSNPPELWFELQDSDYDGIDDTLMVKFDRSAVQEILEVGDEVEITVTGTVGAIPFVGSDTIKVIDKGS